MLILYRVNSPDVKTDWCVWRRYKSPMLRDSALDVLMSKVSRTRSRIEFISSDDRRR